MSHVHLYLSLSIVTKGQIQPVCVDFLIALHLRSSLSKRPCLLMAQEPNRNRKPEPSEHRALKRGNLTRRERYSRDTRDDGTVTLCNLRAATVLSRGCRADFGRPLTKNVMSHSRDRPGVTAPLQTNIVPLTGMWNPPLPLPPLKKSPGTILPETGRGTGTVPTGPGD